MNEILILLNCKVDRFFEDVREIYKVGKIEIIVDFYLIYNFED